MSQHVQLPPPPPLQLPPPPPLPLVQLQQTTVNPSKHVTQLNSKEDIEKVLQERLKKNVKKRPGKKTIVYVNQEVTPVLQDGPSCGLVALQMAGQIFSISLSLEEIFSTAKNRGFTLQGEMFSASNMEALVECLFGDVTVTSLDMNRHQENLVDHLIKGDICLIPYDADFNHEPCNKRGHKAHWAVITGYGLVLDDSVCDTKGLTVDDHCTLNASPDCVLAHGLLGESEDILVFGLHGKSQYPGVWSLSNLIASNRNLTEIDPQREENDVGYIVPEEGISVSLCSKALILCNRINEYNL